MTEALCITHKVDISDTSKKTFTEPFIDTVVALNEAILNGSAQRQLQEFKRFVNEFGTHYVKHANMGAFYGMQSEISHDNWYKMVNNGFDIGLYASYGAKALLSVLPTNI